VSKIVVCDGCGKKSPAVPGAAPQDWLVVEIKTVAGTRQVTGDFHSFACLETAVRTRGDKVKAGKP
jgi:hypothetical protein